MATANYRFSDYLKVGLPMVAILATVLPAKAAARQGTLAEETLDLIVGWFAAGPSTRTTLADPPYRPKRRHAAR